MLETLIELDQWLFGILNGQWHHSWLDAIMPIWRNKTTWIPLYLSLFLIIAKNRKGKTIWVLLCIVVTIVLADQISSELIKKTVERLRPCNDSLVEARLLLEHCGGGFSFTSSHACNHVALATILWLIFREKWHFLTGILLFVWAITIAYAQVYVGVHYPLDILAGALLGFGIAKLVYFMAKKTSVIHKIWN